MSEKILKIEEVTGAKINDSNSWGGFDGYRVTTNKQEALVMISNDQSCCESWGYFTSEDDHEQFIGADLLGVTLVDAALNEKKLKDEIEYGLDEGGIQFVNFETSRGTFQLTVYNAHNGYYSHPIKIKSTQVSTDDEYL